MPPVTSAALYSALYSKTEVLLLLSHCLLLLPLFVGFYCVRSFFLMKYFVSLLFLQLSILAEEERTGCVSLIFSLLTCGCAWCRGLVCIV